MTGELCDLANDPLEVDNLFGNPDPAMLQRELSDMAMRCNLDWVDTLPQPVEMA